MSLIVKKWNTTKLLRLRGNLNVEKHWLCSQTITISIVALFRQSFVGFLIPPSVDRTDTSVSDENDTTVHSLTDDRSTTRNIGRTSKNERSTTKWYIKPVGICVFLEVNWKRRSRRVVWSSRSRRSTTITTMEREIPRAIKNNKSIDDGWVTTTPIVCFVGWADVPVKHKCRDMIFTSNCQWAACSNCLAWSRAHPAANTNWLIITCSRNESIADVSLRVSTRRRGKMYGQSDAFRGQNIASVPCVGSDCRHTCPSIHSRAIIIIVNIS